MPEEELRPFRDLVLGRNPEGHSLQEFFDDNYPSPAPHIDDNLAGMVPLGWVWNGEFHWLEEGRRYAEENGWEVTDTGYKYETPFGSIEVGSREEDELD